MRPHPPRRAAGLTAARERMSGHSGSSRSMDESVRFGTTRPCHRQNPPACFGAEQRAIACCSASTWRHVRPGNPRYLRGCAQSTMKRRYLLHYTDWKPRTMVASSKTPDRRYDHGEWVKNDRPAVQGGGHHETGRRRAGTRAPDRVRSNSREIFLGVMAFPSVTIPTLAQRPWVVGGGGNPRRMRRARDEGARGAGQRRGNTAGLQLRVRAAANR